MKSSNSIPHGTRNTKAISFRHAAKAPSPRVVQCEATSGLKSVRLAGVGSAIPITKITNDDLSNFVDTNDEWIASRTGIRSRHVLGKGETIAMLAQKACNDAMEMAGVTADDIDMILFATSSPDDIFGDACSLQALIGAKKAVAFDLTAACSGFVIGMITATQFIRGGSYKNVLVVGGDALSRFVDWRDRGTCILFGDGCGAMVMTAGEEGSEDSMLGYAMHSDGVGSKFLNCPFQGEGEKVHSESGASSLGAYANVKMAGQDVFKFAVRAVPSVIEESLEKAGLQKEDVQWLVMHQANQRILDAAAQRLGLPAERVVSNLADVGNTSAASIPLALTGAVKSGAIKKGDVLAMAGFGAGLTWAGAIVRWG